MKAYRIIIPLLLTSLGTTAATPDEALEAFNRKTTAATANAFFESLLEEEFIDEGTDFAEGTPTDSLQQQVWYWAAEWLYDRQQYEMAEAYGLKALPKYSPSNPEKADCLNILGCIYVRMGNVKQAANYAKQSVEIELQGGDHDRISSSLNTLAGIYMAGYQAKEAESIILQALEHADKVDNPGRKAIILGMAAEIYHTLGNDDKALPYAEQAIEIEEQLGRTQKLPIRLSQKGSALLGLHRYEEAEDIYRQIVPQLKAMGDYHSYAIALNRLGMSLLCQNRPQDAIPYYKEAADLFSRMGDLYNEIHSHRGLYESYWNIDPDSAKAELDLFDLLKDSLYTHSTAEALSRYNAEFGNEQLQKENAEVRLAHRRTVIIGTSLILLIAVVAWLILRHHQRRWQRQMQELVKEVEQMRLCLDGKGKASPTPQDADGEDALAEELAKMEEKGMAREDTTFLLRVIEAVNEAMPAGNFGVEQIAAALNMSIQTFRRRMQDTAGETPKAYIQAIQMERAVTLLTDNPEKTISQISELCGFSETSSFNHTFRRIYGCSPSQFREQSRQAS